MSKNAIRTAVAILLLAILVVAVVYRDTLDARAVEAWVA